MIRSPLTQLRHSSGGYLKRIGCFQLVESWAIVDDWRAAGFFEAEDGEHFAAQREAPIAWDEFTLVPATACGCCGQFSADKRGGPWTTTFKEVEREIWRCEKHVGRLPCCIEGCGRTFAMKPDDSYRGTVMCGAHWRQAPKYMRDAVARLTRRIRKPKRTDNLDHLYARHHRLWMRCRRAIVEGQNLDMAEIERMFGLDV